MNSKNFSLTEQEHQALETLCAETFASRAPVDAVNFRADHEEFRAVIRRLCQFRYVDEDYSTQTYVPTVLGLREVGSEDCNGVLALGARLLELFRQRYRNKETRKQNFLLGDIAAQLGVDRVELNFSMWLLSSVLAPTLAGRSTNPEGEDAYVLPWEQIYDYPTIDSMVAVYEGYRDQALNSSYALPTLGNHPPVVNPETTLFDMGLVAALPDAFGQVLAEIEIAVSNKLTCLAVMGLRAVLEMLANNRVGDVGGFERKIDLMEEKKLLNSNQVELLKAALEVGHAAAHRMHVPSECECRQVLDIVVHLLREHYVLAPNAKKLMGSAPPRDKRS